MRDEQVYLIKHRMDEDAAQAVQDAVVQEVAEELVSLDEEVSSGELGKLAMDARISRLQEIRTRIGGFESILNVGMDRLKAEAERLELAALKAAMLADRKGANS